jgi:phosphoribosylformimino-5-aminoimidazole carboxamide ribonucleotide (ProFAR) isomerase
MHESLATKVNRSRHTRIIATNIDVEGAGFIGRDFDLVGKIQTVCRDS